MSGRPRPASATGERGFSLIELMIALALGLIVVLAASAVFLSNKQSYRTNLALGQVQENSRIAYELLARDIRQAGLTGCGNSGRIANVLNNQTTDWWANFGNAIRGYEGDQDDPAVTEGGASAQRVVGTDSLQLIGVTDSGLSVVSHHYQAAELKINETTTEVADGDVVVVCDPDHAAIMQIQYNSSNVTVRHNTGTGSPGNCSKGLGFPTLCTTLGSEYEFGRNSQIARLNAVDWYIGNNPLGGRSLYRIAVVNSAGVPTPTAQEMVRNVTDMQLTYHVAGASDFVTAAAVTTAGSWGSTNAVRLTLTLRSSEQMAGTDTQPIVRQVSFPVNLRNR
ncbi:MAG: prepilin-type N-terminal cleavage/methylation domain-containing protein [Nevskiaceae bacterium]|nr:MAG: prepilin-type N-terminal cleavage/methylation domain-containing protein [Nevskiaceae bacterium]TAM23148.1 MAG: prepilin-type N-terminal cleavage/methylation domain-containing protein [Nevskiaceae bacterium]